MNAIFTGRKRSGKTTLAFDIAMRNGGGIIIFDPKREWRGWPGTITDADQLEETVKAGHEVIIFHPEGDKREAFAPLAKSVAELHKIAMEKGWDKSGYHFTFIVDEAVNVSTATWVDPNLLSLMAENRPEILDIFLTFQSPKDANNLLKSRVDTWFIFNTSLPSDLEYLNKQVGVPETDLDEIQHLREHEYAHFTFDGGTPKVEYDYEPDKWFRPMEYFELNQNEREDINNMAREEEVSLKDLFEDFMDFMEDKKRRRRDDNDSRDDRRDRRDDHRSDSRRDSREKVYKLSGY
jgi:hypothetical protein